MNFKQFHKVVSTENWSVNDMGLGNDVKLIAIDTQVVASHEEIRNVLSKFNPGENVNITVQTVDDEIITFAIKLSEFSSIDSLAYYYLPYLAGWVCLISGLWILSDRRWQSLSLAYAVLAGGLSLIFFSWFDYFSTHAIVSLYYIGFAMMSGALAQIAVLIPRTKRLISNPVPISFLGYPINLLLVGLGFFQLKQPALNILPISPVIIFHVTLGISLIFLIISLFLFISEPLSPYFEKYSHSLLGATLLSSLPYSIYLLTSLINSIEPLGNPLMILPLCIMPITLVILHHPAILPRTNEFGLRAIIYLFLAFSFGVFYSLVLFILNSFLDTPISLENPLILGTLIFVTVLIFYPLRKRMEEIMLTPANLINENSVALSIKYSENLSCADSLELANRILHDAIMEIIDPEKLLIFLYDPELSAYASIDPYHLTNAPQLVLPANANIPATLKKTRTSMYFRNLPVTGPDLSGDSKLLDELDIHLNVPIPGSDGLLGWISLGNRRKNEQYGDREINLLESFSTQLSLIYERSQTINSLSYRLKEMETLHKIAVSINRINDFDSLLITISEQLQQVIPFDQISLVMEANDADGFQRQFLYQDQKILISSQDPIKLDEEYPELEAILGRKIVLQDAEQGNILIIPLEGEDKVIGALSLVSKEKKILLEQTDLNLIYSIGSLVSGAIIKTRLLQSSQAQTHYLSVLNQVSRQISSTLVMEQLLKTLVENAVTILNGSSGILITREENADNLVIEVTAGEINPQIQGKRVVILEKLAKEAFNSHKSLIINQYNDIDYSPLLISQVTEFNVKNIIVTPLISNNIVIGLLEVINKNNNLPFTDRDLEMLEGFAGQAAVAINNAKLYRKTDRALERRIDELSLMQQIDRELHSSPSLDAALQTTLRAAVSQTQALCGTIALVDTYNNEIEMIWQTIPGQEQIRSLEDMDLRDFVWFSKETTESYQIIDSSVSELSEALKLPVPCETHFLIQAELEVNEYVLLILHLESADKLIESDIEFLVRLNDHAAIALRNAFLYDDLQTAVQSKNEFIGFISHELKNPLTAIKGHADILAKGMVGEINAEQEDFLRTISHNVRRMSTFITDLSDQSHIESKSLRITFAATSANEVLAEVLHTFEQGIKEKSINIKQNFKPDLPEVWCDRLRLIQVLSNLVSNAVKYTPEGGHIEIGAAYAINNWDQEGAAEVVHFWVEDDGYGIAEGDQEHIFEKFYRGTSDHILKIQGTGLGLRISKSLVEMMGGTMWFVSAPGEGSTFHFTIPI
ncbi:MAG: GAF domain-containing protein [Anaerolineaceae bacterium]|nr:GAF domain-containing protein [Anaerolineaceae bacterium]